MDKSLNYGREQIRSFLSKCAPYENVLDLGAGWGADLKCARDVCQSRLYGIELYPPYADALRKDGVDVSSINLENDGFPYPDSFFDVVIANQVLEHTKEIFWIAHEVSRILKVGGHFIIGVPNLASLHNRILLSIGRQPTPIKSFSAHVRGFTRSDLLGFFEGGFPNGYACIAKGGANFYPFPAAIAQPLARLFPSMAWGMFLLLRKMKPYRREFLQALETGNFETPFYAG